MWVILLYIFPQLFYVPNRRCTDCNEFGHDQCTFLKNLAGRKQIREHILFDCWENKFIHAGICFQHALKFWYHIFYLIIVGLWCLLFRKSNENMQIVKHWRQGSHLVLNPPCSSWTFIPDKRILHKQRLAFEETPFQISPSKKVIDTNVVILRFHVKRVLLERVIKWVDNVPLFSFD